MRTTLGRRAAVALALTVGVLLAWEGKADPAGGLPEKRVVTIPIANPMKGFDAGTLAWNGATQILDASSRAIAGAADLDQNLAGRFANLGIAAYLAGAAFYYSHEIAHSYHQKAEIRHFWLDLTDWTPFFPKANLNSWRDVWDEQELERYVHGHDVAFDARIQRWIVLMEESGLYQDKCNARIAAQVSAKAGRTTVFNAVSFVMNHGDDTFYSLTYGKDPVRSVPSLGYTLINDNDITGYVSTMRELGTTISRDDWLAASILAFALSGGTWNSTRAGYAYLARGEKSVDNLSWGVSDHFGVSPPNFYLFPTYRGLYLESETCINLGSANRNRVHFVLGTGLDSFGLHQTGPVDWLRIGGRFDAVGLNARLFRLSISPYCYIDSSRDLSYRGRSIGAELSCPLWKRFSLYGKVEHNRNDIMEGIIKGKDEGIYALATVGFRLGNADSVQ